MFVNTIALPAHVAFKVRLPDTDVIVKGIYRGTAREVYSAEGRKTSRVYGALETLVPEMMELEPFVGTLIPLSGPDRSAEDNARSAMWNAWKRETVKEGTARLRAVLGDVFSALIAQGIGEYVLPEKITFSQKAGCTLCPCSPGFVLDVRYTCDDRPIDLYLSVSALS